MTRRSALVTGGAGFIGSAVVRALQARGDEIVVVDDLSRGSRSSIPTGVSFVEGDVRSAADLDRAFGRLHGDGPRSVFHLAGLTFIAESFRRPAAYFSVNTDGTIAVLEAALRAQAERIVFSSTCAVYGNPETLPVSESAAIGPVNPYGESKWAAERALHGSGRDVRVAVLRFFNAAGATSYAREPSGEYQRILPLAIRAALGCEPPLTLFGNQFPTPDGTAVRDFVHIVDLADAHLRADDALARQPSLVVNLGSGRGTSLAEAFRAIEEVVGRPVPYRKAEARPGEAVELIADAGRAELLLGWKPKRSDIETLVRDTLQQESPPNV